MQKFTKIFIITILTIFLTSLHINNVNAASEFEIRNTSFKFNIQNNLDANVTLQFSLKNISRKNNLIHGYEMILPFTGIKNTKTRLNNRLIKTIRNENRKLGVTSIRFDFGNQLLLPGRTKKIAATFSISKIVKSNKDLKYLTLGSNVVEDVVKFQNIEINYPSSLFEPTIISDKDYRLVKSTSNYKISYTNNDSKVILIAWGTEYSTDIISSFTLTNNEKKDIKSLFSLIPTNESQEVLYKSIQNTEFGLYDSLYNTFGITELLEGQKKQVTFESRINKTFKNLSFNSSNLNNSFNIDEQSAFWNDLKVILDSNLSQNDKFVSLNNYLLKKYSASTKLSYDIKNLSTFWVNMDKKKTLSSFEFCYVVSAFASKLSLNTELAYGYITFPVIKDYNKNPHFWCKVKLDDKVILLDPYFQSLSGINYIAQSTEFDRIQVGSWEENQTYNKALALLDNDASLQPIQFTTFQEFPSQTNENIINLITPTKVVSGFYYSADFSFYNAKNQILYVNEISLDNKILTDEINLQDNLKLAMLPLQHNIIKFDKFREANFFRYGLSLVPVNISFNNKNIPSETSTISVEYKLHDGAIIMLVIVFNLFVLISLIVLWRKVISKRINNEKSNSSLQDFRENAFRNY